MKNLNSKRFVLASLTLSATCLISAQANVGATNIHAESFDFYHKNWQLVCDNTRTCRAVGYQDDYTDDNQISNPVALMLKRNAGANQRVRAYVMFGDDPYFMEDAEKIPNCKLTSPIITINDKSFGSLGTPDKEDYSYELTTKQTHELINTLPTSSKIEFVVDCYHYQVSDKGSTAVLLKMDEVQGRIDTKGAIVKRGNKSESSVLPALPTPVVHAVTIDDEKMQRDSDDALFAKLESKMDNLAIATLRTTDSYETSDYCNLLTEEESDFNRDFKGWHFTRLDKNKLLASHDCWMGAYNFGTGFWVMNDKPPYQVKLVTDSGVSYSQGVISLSHKDRGIGDCWNGASWRWAKTNRGMEFIKVEEFNTGMCKGIAAGGAFVLPTLVTEVIE
ncbi:DUF1176 domain-containing protein [Psychrobacter sp. HD31]|uniref:DUF1176 domain-containing protein n=1 Tax=Psychrobacter sp. HD31 TaxID=3112003 RepID=UPI003DA45536